MKTYLKKTDFVILSAQSSQQVERFVQKPIKTRSLNRPNFTHVLHLMTSKDVSWHGKLINSAQQILIRSLGNLPSCLRVPYQTIWFCKPWPAEIFFNKSINVLISFCCSLWTSRFFFFFFCSKYFSWLDLFYCDPTLTTSRIFVHGFLI